MSNDEYEQQQFWKEESKWITWVSNEGVRFHFLNKDPTCKTGEIVPENKEEKWSFKGAILNFNKEDIKLIKLNGK